MLVNKLLQDEYSFTMHLTENASNHKYIVEALKHAVVFTIDKQAYQLIDKLCEPVNYEKIPPPKCPHPIVFFEVEREIKSDIDTFTKQGILAIEFDDGIYTYFLNCNSTKFVLCGDYAILTNEGFSVHSLNEDENHKDAMSYIGSLAHSFYDILYCINCKDLVEIKPSKISKLNTKRSKKGKNKLKEYSRVVIKLSQQEKREILNSRATGGKKCHLRRGHFRNLPDRAVWVKNCVVNKHKMEEKPETKYTVTK